MIGFDDPIFDPAELARELDRVRRFSERGENRSSRVSVNIPAYTDFWKGARVDRFRLAQALPTLVNTAIELKEVAAKLGASESDIYLEKDATEAAVKRAALDDYRIVYFATHGARSGRC